MKNGENMTIPAIEFPILSRLTKTLPQIATVPGFSHIRQILAANTLFVNTAQADFDELDRQMKQRLTMT